MKKIKGLLIGTAMLVVSIVPVFANVAVESVSDQVSDAKPSTTDPVALKGDVDGDGEIKLKDAQLALKIALNLMEPTDKQRAAADVDGNSKVELKDAQKILRVALNLATF